ncbi:MAG: 3-dehydroquinate synthase [Polyangiaceae bacterium]|jgi:shikimate kinase/3-dehydroquinate synthase
MRSVIISGFMGTGKTTVGPRVASRLGLPFVDTDAELERSAGRSVRELWERDGEAAFRAREAALAQSLLDDAAPKVIAFGGGTVVNPRTRRRAIDRAIVVTLQAAPEAIVARVGSGAGRPNLRDGGDPLERTRELLAARADAYAEAHATLATDSSDADGVADAVIEVVRRDPLLVPLGTRSYAIDVCVAEPNRLKHAIARCEPSSILWVTDSNVQAARGAALERALGAYRGPVERVVLPPGEENKTAATVGDVWDAALRSRIDRDALVLAAGGGVVGDLAGFAAATLLRGIRFIQVPTTLLSMVDSSVGGKTGFDHPAGKNLIGAFHQPSAVVADLDHLRTLEARQRAAGLAEVAKIAVATDEGLLFRVEQTVSALAAGDVEAMRPVVRAAIDAKIRIVRDDERESGARALLNLGHTLGHALEAQGGFSRWLHGEAVSLGMVAEMDATAAMGWTDRALVERTRSLLERLGLPTRVGREDLAAAWPFVASDKKRAGDWVRLPVVTASGRSHIERVRLEDFRAVLLGC